jgi:hypothetical protein
MIVTLLLLLSALSLSAIAGYFSVIGMTAIFAAAWWPVVIMTGMLEFSKVVVASWLYRNWDVTPRLLKGYLAVSVVVLMFITSLGIFGFLSKAHIDQTLGLGDNRLIIAQIDQQIEVEKSKIDDNRKVIQQMDEAVSSILSQSTSAATQRANRGATIAQQAAQLRTRQKPDRDLLNRAVDESNARIREFNSQKLKLEQGQLKLEAEVGPIKYIAEMIYGNDPSKDLLEKAVRYVIILIIFVFDPLAVLMIIAANMSLASRKNIVPVTTEQMQTRRDPKPSKYQPEARPRASETDLYKADERNGLAWAEARTSSASYQVPMSYPTASAEKDKPEIETTSNLPKVDDSIAPITEDITNLQTAMKLPSATVDTSVSAPVEPILISESLSVETADTSNLLVQDSMVFEDPIKTNKPDDILQTIKQYHTVRLDDAKRTI